MFESLFDASSVSLTITDTFLMISFSLISGIIISITYMKTFKNGNYNENFALTMILLPAVISLIIMLIGSDIARAFSLAGAFSIIRFRSAPGEPKDIAYVLFSLAAGLAAGIGAYLYSIMLTLVLCLFMIVLGKIKFGQKKVITKQLVITIPESLDYEKEIQPLFQSFNIFYTLKKVKTASLGSLFKLYYDVTYKEDMPTKDFMDELRVINSNLDITLILLEDEQY